MIARVGRTLGATFIVGAYMLTLLTQIPHIQDVYQSLERQEHTVLAFGLALSTAWGAAVAFEISVAIFTWRLIVNTSSARSKWTKRGVVGFLVLSFIANLAYYFDWQVGPVSLDAHVMPFLLAAALPLALWLYAEEFGSEAGAAVKRSERTRRKEERERQVKEEEVFDYEVGTYLCWCGEFAPDPDRHKLEVQARGALGAHTRVHRSQARDILGKDGTAPSDVRDYFEGRYRLARDGRDDLPPIPELWEIGTWGSD